MFITQQSLLSHSSLINRYGLVLSLRLRELKQFTHIHTAREWKSLDSGSRFLSSKLRLSSMLQGSSVKLECVTWQWKISSEGFCKLLHIQSIKSNQPGCWWLTPVILVTWEAEIRRIMVWGQSVNSSRDPPISKITITKWTGSVVQVIRAPALQEQSPALKTQS
jgi:hypothetical protein